MGSTFIVKFFEVPVQPLATGVTVKLAVAVVNDVFVPPNAPIFPEPLAAPRPIVVLLLVQLNAVPATVPPKTIAFVVVPFRMVWLVMELTVGVGFTVTATVKTVLDTTSVTV